MPRIRLIKIHVKIIPTCFFLTNPLFSKIRIVQRRIIILPGRMKEAIEEHRAVLKAIMDGNADEAERLKRINLQNATECLKKYKKWVF